MAKYQFTLLSPVGAGKTKKTGTLLDLLESVPYFLIKKRLPSLAVINDVLNKGSHDAGMSGGSRWAPFTIHADEYKVLTAESIKKGYSVATLPSWVKTQSDFHIWEFE
ncbi:MAG: hypothetical protein JW925_13975, partial [Syntrophaceae bacterium]|nr:hypothetical protein [Syntrophaceae bacterium]